MIEKDSTRLLTTPPESLAAFYQAMSATVPLRRRIVRALCDNRGIVSDDSALLKRFHAVLTTAANDAHELTVMLDDRRRISIDISYEVLELEKDIIYLTGGDEALQEHFRLIHPGFEQQSGRLSDLMSSRTIRTFCTDRDGTINNYCSRYLTSVQSIWNAVYCTQFARSGIQTGIILTSAPLMNPGMVDISTMPEGTFILAGSKGREYHCREGEYGMLPIDPRQQQHLEKLNSRITDIVKETDYEKFGLIGSGFQKKFGQTTIARQDIKHSVPEEESMGFLATIRELVSELDPGGREFRIEDTGLDIEILLTVPQTNTSAGGGVRDFHKGDGVEFLNKSLRCGMEQGGSCICGDTPSDIPMIDASLRLSKETLAVFVTSQEALRKKVQSVHPDAVFVDTPDMLVTALYTYVH